MLSRNEYDDKMASLGHKVFYKIEIPNTAQTLQFINAGGTFTFGVSIVCSTSSSSCSFTQQLTC